MYMAVADSTTVPTAKPAGRGSIHISARDFIWADFINITGGLKLP